MTTTATATLIANTALDNEPPIDATTTTTTTTTTTMINDDDVGGGDKQEPLSLAESRTSDHSENTTATTTTTTTSSSSSSGGSDDEEEEEIRCSAVHTLERDMPDYDYSDQVEQLRAMILEYARDNVGLYSESDLERCKHDQWYLSRFLLRQKMDLDEAFDMLKKTMRFNQESLAHCLKPEDFPAEFYQLGGLFPYGQDRKGNRMLYLRVRVHRKVPEIQAILQTFIYFNIKQLDELAQGKGICLVIDCTGAGIANADMESLLFIISTLKSYFPKGLSYFLVNELPWILKPFWHIAKAWVPDEHRQLIKFSDSRTIFEYIEREQLPDFLGGCGQPEEYKRVPENCVNLEQGAKLWGIERHLIRKVLDKFKEHLPEETVARIEAYIAQGEDGPASAHTSETDHAWADDSDDGLVADQDPEKVD